MMKPIHCLPIATSIVIAFLQDRKDLHSSDYCEMKTPYSASSRYSEVHDSFHDDCMGRRMPTSPADIARCDGNIGIMSPLTMHDVAAELQMVEHKRGVLPVTTCCNE